MLLGGGSENIASVKSECFEKRTTEQGLTDGLVDDEPAYTAEGESSSMTYVELSIQNKSAGAYELAALAIGIARGHVERTRPGEISMV